MTDRAGAVSSRRKQPSAATCASVLGKWILGGLTPLRLLWRAPSTGGHGLAGVRLPTGCDGCGEGAFLTRIHGTKVQNQPSEIVIFGSDFCVLFVHELMLLLTLSSVISAAVNRSCLPWRILMSIQHGTVSDRSSPLFAHGPSWNMLFGVGQQVKQVIRVTPRSETVSLLLGIFAEVGDGSFPYKV